MATLVTQIDNATFVEPLIRQSLEKIKAQIIQNMSVKKRNASGQSVRSLKVTTTPVSGTLTGLRGFMAMETGRKGGKVPRNFVDIITQWINDKHIPLVSYGNYLPTPHNIAWLIVRKIRKDGTELSHRSPDDIYSTAIEREYYLLNTKIAAHFGSAIDYIHKQYANLKEVM